MWRSRVQSPLVLFDLLNRPSSGIERPAGMRRLTRILIASAMACSVGCRRNEGGENTSPAAAGDVLVRSHFVGTASLAGDTNGAAFKQIWALPETSRFAEQTLQKLSHSPRVFYGDQITPAQDERGAALLRPLLDDLLR